MACGISEHPTDLAAVFWLTFRTALCKEPMLSRLRGFEEVSLTSFKENYSYLVRLKSASFHDRHQFY